LEDELKEIPLEDIYWLDDTDITEEQIRNMATSLMVHGQIEPIVVTGPDENGKYRGVVGRLRYEGMKKRWENEPEGKTILARVHKFKNELEIKMWQLAENLHRRRLPAMQKAKQLKALYDIMREEYGEEATIQTLANAIEDMTGEKESVKTIHHYLSLTRLEPEVQEILTREKWPLRWGLELLRIKDPKKQVETAKRILKETKDEYFPIKSVERVKTVVDEATAEERRQKRNEQLKRKAEQLERETGKKVYVDSLISFEDREKFHEWWNPEDIPEECKSCEKTGILLEANFHQKPICLDPECWKKKREEQHKREEEERKKLKKLLETEQRKVWDVPEYDERHWRLAVLAHIPSWDLREQYGLDRWGGIDEELVQKVQSLTVEECQRLLVRKAVDELLTGASAWSGEEAVKKWEVEAFNLRRKVFLKPEKEVSEK